MGVLLRTGEIMSSFSFESGKTYNFSTYSPARLGQDHVNMRCTGVELFDKAIKTVPNLVETFTIVAPSLPAGTAKDYRLPRYVTFLDVNGNSHCFADIWINTATVRLVTRHYAVFTISDPGFTHSDLNVINRVLAGYGYRNVTYELKDYGS